MLQDDDVSNTMLLDDDVSNTNDIIVTYVNIRKIIYHKQITIKNLWWWTISYFKAILLLH